MASERFGLLLAATCLNGLCNLAHFSVAYEMSVHFGRGQAGEATVCGVVNLLANALGFAFILGLTPLLDGATKEDVLWTSLTLLGVLLLALTLMLISRPS